MASLSSLYIKKETLEEILLVLMKKQEKGVTLTIAHNDEKNEYKQDVSAWVEQTEEQKMANKPRYYVGNGRKYWEKLPERPAAPNPAPNPAPKPEQKSDDDDLPW